MDLRWSGAALKSEESEGTCAGVVYNERSKEKDEGTSDDDGGWDTQVRGKERRYIWGQRMDRTNIDPRTSR